MALTNIDLDRIDGNSGTLANVNTSSINGGPLAGFRNQIINGDFRIWQRGTSVQVTNNGYCADRWIKGGAAATTIVRSNNAPDGFAYSLALDGNSNNIGTTIELPKAGNPGQFVQNSTWTFSIWSDVDLTEAGRSAGARFSDGSSTFGNAQAAGVGAWEATADAASNGFTRYKCVITIGNTQPVATNILFHLYILTPTGSGSNYAGAQLEPGPVATPFEHRPIGTELALCQRYYCAPAAASGTAGGFFGMPRAAALSQADGWAPFPVQMRVAPTVTIGGTSQPGRFIEGGGTAFYIGVNGFPNVLRNGSANYFAGEAVTAYYTADAEL